MWYSVHSVLLSDITNVVFCVIHFNMFYENIPAEVGLVKFSLGNGVIKVLNDLICVKKLPLGAGYEAGKVAMETHGLPLPPKALGDGSVSYILAKIKEFCSKDGITNENVMTFCLPDDTVNVESGLAYLRNESGSLEDDLIVSDFVELGHQVIKVVSEPEEIDSYENWIKYIGQDPFDSLVNGCDVHDELDRNKFCSSSIVKRLAFQLINVCSKHLKLDLIPGVHMPQRAF